MNVRITHISLLCFTFLLTGLSLFGQTKKDSLMKEASFLLLRNQIDSAQTLVANAEMNQPLSSTDKLIKAVVNGKRLSNKQYNEFFRIVLKHHDLNYFNLYDAQERILKEPKSKKIDLEYVETLWLISSRIRDDGNIDLGNAIQKKLLSYVEKFKGDSKEEKKARIICKYNDLVMLVIQRKWEEGLRRTEPLVKQAIELKDTSLIVSTKYYQCEFLLLKEDLLNFIKISRECYELDKDRKTKSDFYVSSMIHLCDALIYQGGNREEVLSILDEMYRDPETRVHSYSLYAKLLSFAKDDKEVYAAPIFSQFGVTNILDFCRIIFPESKERLTPNEHYYVLLEGARALNNYRESQAALNTMNRAVEVRRAIYSTELANALANHKTEKVRMETEAELKEKEIKMANEKFLSTVYIVTAIIVFLFLCIAVFALRKQRVQSRLLKSRNEEISEKNVILEKQDKEKSLLVKEIHHRVKNNFQIISSLLELQVRGVEDNQVQELVAEGQRRVKSMAIIHEKLYQNDDMQIELDNYIEQLAKEIHTAYATKEVDLDLRVPANTVFDIDTAIPLGLIINELITNAFKYGFSVDRQNILKVELTKDAEYYELVVSDNGPGIKGDIKTKNTNSLGLHLVKRLSKQLHGKFDYSNDNGAVFSVKFKDTEMRME